MTVTILPDPTANSLSGSEAQSQPDSYFGTEEVDTQSEYQAPLRFPHYYANAVDDDDRQGLAVLSDALTCIITWNYNQAPTLQMTYPRDGIASKIIKPEGIIMSDVNPFLTHQKFRIRQVLKSENNIVVNATHIIADIGNFPIFGKLSMPSVTSTDFFDWLSEHATGSIPDIRYDSDINKVANVDISQDNATNFSNYVFDVDAEGDKPTTSLLGLYGGELIPDNYHLIHLKHAGKKTGIHIKYKGELQTIQQDQNIENTYTAIYPWAKYTPATPKATEINTDWSNWAPDYTSIGSITYQANGPVDIYDSPVAGHHVVGQLAIGMHIKLGDPVTSGMMTPDGKFEIDTENGDTWYPIATEDGGGWIDGQFVNFSKDGDYLVNDAVGYVHTAIKDTDSKNTHYPVAGTGTVNYNSGGKSIRIFYSPDKGKGYKPTGKRLKNGQKFHYNQVAVDENGDKWYRIGAHQWVYGPHTKVGSEQDISYYPSHGQGYVKKGAIAYHIDKNGMMVPKTHASKLVSTRKKKVPKYKYVWKGTGRNRHKVKVKSYYSKTIKYHKQEKTKVNRGKKGVVGLNLGQVSVGGTIYYKTSSNTYVKSSSIDWKCESSRQPTLPKDLIKATASKKGYIELYSAPSKGSSMNITIPVGGGYAVNHTAQSGDGTTWYEISYKNKNGKEITGWIPSDLTDTSADGDLEPTAKDKSGTDDSDSSTTVPQQTEVIVTLGDGASGLVYPANAGNHEVQRILKVDLSAYIKHDDSDYSGMQDDGTFVATDDDKRQLKDVADQYVIEHRIGQPLVSLNVTKVQSHSIEGDLTQVSMYDLAVVNYPQLVVDEEAQVTSTVYDALAHIYQSVYFGDLPKSWQHLLVDAANKNTDDLRQSTRQSFKRTGHLFQDMHAAIKKEGSDRVAAELKIAKQVGLVDDKTKQLDIDYKTLDNQITSIDANVTEMGNEIRNGGTQELQFVDHSGYSNFLHPTEIRAVNDDGSYLRFNSEGLGWFDSKNGQLRTAITADGELAAERISAGIIRSLNIDTGEIHGALKVGDSNGGIQISIGTRQPTENPLRPNFGGNGIWLDGGQYHSLVSAGRFVTKDSSEGDTWEYGTNGPMHNGSFLKSIVKGWVDSWIHKTVTVGGKKYPIYR